MNHGTSQLYHGFPGCMVCTLPVVICIPVLVYPCVLVYPWNSPMIEICFLDYLDPDFWNLLRQRSTTTTSHDISDIYDGTEYSKYTKAGGFLCPETSPANLSFCLNTDRVALFKSSHANIWPLFLVINELPSPEKYTGDESNPFVRVHWAYT